MPVRHTHRRGRRFAAGLSYAEIAADFPEVGEDEVRACRAYAADSERRVVVAG